MNWATWPGHKIFSWTHLSEKIIFLISLEISLHYLGKKLKNKLTVKQPPIFRTNIFGENSGLRTLLSLFLRSLLSFAQLYNKFVYYNSSSLDSSVLLLRLENFPWTVADCGTKVLSPKLLMLQKFIPNLNIAIEFNVLGIGFRYNAPRKINFQGYYAATAEKREPQLLLWLCSKCEQCHL